MSITARYEYLYRESTTTLRHRRTLPVRYHGQTFPLSVHPPFVHLSSNYPKRRGNGRGVYRKSYPKLFHQTPARSTTSPRISASNRSNRPNASPVMIGYQRWQKTIGRPSRGAGRFPTPVASARPERKDPSPDYT